MLVGIDHASQSFQLECRGEPCGIDDVAEHHCQVALFGRRPWRTVGRFGRRRSASERRRRERIDGGTQFLAISERQAKLPKIRIT